MKYLMIPIRHLCEPHEEKPSESDVRELGLEVAQQNQNDRKRASLLEDVAKGYLPGWAFSVYDLEKHVKVVDGLDLDKV